MEELPLVWQLVVTVVPSIGTPVIAGALTIWGVNIAANRADKRRSDDQKDENRRRKADLEERRAEREEQRLIVLNDRQRHAVGNFLTSVRESQLEMDTSLNEIIISPQSGLADLTEPYMMGRMKSYTKQREIYGRCSEGLDQAWHLLDLEVTHPAVRKAMAPIREEIKSFALEYRCYAIQCGEHSRSVANYMKECIADDREPDPFKDFPAPSFIPRFTSISAPPLEQLKRAARQHLNLPID